MPARLGHVVGTDYWTDAFLEAALKASEWVRKEQEHSFDAMASAMAERAIYLHT